MRTTTMISTRGLWLFVAALGLGGCHRESNRSLEGELWEINAIAAQRDSLSRELVENSRLISDIGTALAKIQERKKGGVESADLNTNLSDREFVLHKIQEVAARVNASEARLAASERKVRALTKSSDSLRAVFDVSVADFQIILDNQKATITVLTGQINTLQSDNLRLAQENAALSDTVTALTDKDNRVFYVIGSKKELIQRGVLVEEGNKFLVFGKKTLQPARDLNAAEFAAIDKRQVAEIQLPKPQKRYRIVSRQNLSHLAAQATSGAKVSGSIQIASAEGFWAPSKYLIVVEQ